MSVRGQGGSGKSGSGRSDQRPILGESQAVRDLLRMVERVAQAKTNILIIGESGTGKELVARLIHDSGPLKQAPFVPVNCGAIPETLIESEMFGHKKGSFTGAVSDKQGLFEVASGGTLFLDEVGELPLSMQVKLLRAIQERRIKKVGGTEDLRVDVRIIAATNRDLEQGIAKGTFREDLYYRLNVIQIRTPPLRERRGDIRVMAEAFLKRFSQAQGKELRGIAPDALRAIEAYAWPGNVRELENVLERAVTLTMTDHIDLGALPAMIGQAPLGLGGVDAGARATTVTGPAASGASTRPAGGGSDPAPLPGARLISVPAPDFTHGPIDLDRVLGEVEREYLMAALEHAGGTKKRAAELLGMTFRSIRYRLKKLGVDGGDEGDSD